MEMTPHIDAIREDLATAAAIGGDQVLALAQPLLRAVEPSLRGRLLDVLTDAAAEVSGALPAGHVELRLEGREAVFSYVPGREPEPAAVADDGSTARLTLRMPEALKERVERAAAREGTSTNAWLVRTIAGGLDRKTIGSRITGFAES